MDTVSVSYEIATLEESRLLLTTGSERTLRVEPREVAIVVPDAAVVALILVFDVLFLFDATTSTLKYQTKINC